MEEKRGYVYFLTNEQNRVLYTGVTSNLKGRIYHHRKGIVEGFSKRYKLNKLVYYEVYEQISDAIAREKQIKGGPRQKKLDLIRRHNKNFEDLYEKL